jgi:hypothetical protein
MSSAATLHNINASVANFASLSESHVRFSQSRVGVHPKRIRSLAVPARRPLTWRDGRIARRMYDIMRCKVSKKVDFSWARELIMQACLISSRAHAD